MLAARGGTGNAAMDVFENEALDLGLSVEDGLRAYARMLNTLDIEAFAPLIADDFQYASQKVLDEITSKGEFLEYMTKNS